MKNDEEVVTLLNDLKHLSNHSASMLESEGISPDSLYTRKTYAYSQFIHSLSFLDGIITLAEKGQARSAVPLVRGIWESWVGVMFVYSGRTHVWSYYVQLQEELKNKVKRDKLFVAGEIKGEKKIARYKERNLEAHKTINFVKRRYKKLPIIPEVITEKDQNLETRKISLKQKCQIIDYYDNMRLHGKPKKVSLAEHYEWIYSYFSNTAHASPTGLDALFVRKENGGFHVDIGGGQDRAYLAALLLNAYLYHYELMKVFMGCVAPKRLCIPDDIKATRRRLVIRKAVKAVSN